MLKVVLRHPQGVEVVSIHHFGHIGGHAKGFDHTLIGITPHVRRCAIIANILQFDVPDIEHGEVFDHDLETPSGQVLVLMLYILRARAKLASKPSCCPSSPAAAMTISRLPQATAKPYHTCATVPVNSQIRGDTQADARSSLQPPRLSSLRWFFCWPASQWSCILEPQQP